MEASPNGRGGRIGESQKGEGITNGVRHETLGGERTALGRR